MQTDETTYGLVTDCYGQQLQGAADSIRLFSALRCVCSVASPRDNSFCRD